MKGIAELNRQWHLFSESIPPSDVIILVNGPLGFDLAIRIEENLYFKKGDDWSSRNLEHWSYNLPTEWSAIVCHNIEH